jgi:uncharacterized protein (DUF433 family)
MMAAMRGMQPAVRDSPCQVRVLCEWFDCTRREHITRGDASWESRFFDVFGLAAYEVAAAINTSQPLDLEQIQALVPPLGADEFADMVWTRFPDLNALQVIELIQKLFPSLSAAQKFEMIPRFFPALDAAHVIEIIHKFFPSLNARQVFEMIRTFPKLNIIQVIESMGKLLSGKVR